MPFNFHYSHSRLRELLIIHSLFIIKRKEWESNPHESLAPNCFQDSGHRPLACLSVFIKYFCGEQRNWTFASNYFEVSLSRRTQQTNICLFSILILESFFQKKIERIVRIELTSSGWKPDTLNPLSYIRLLYFQYIIYPLINFLERVDRVELTSSG